MKRIERYGIVFWCAAVLALILALAYLTHVKARGAMDVVGAMKAGNVFSVSDVYAIGWNYMVVLNHAADAAEEYGYDLTPAIRKYRETYDGGFVLGEEHSIVLLLDYGYSRGEDIGEAIECGRIIDVIILDMTDPETVAFTLDPAAARETEVFRLYAWDARFRIETADGRKYAVHTGE